MLGPKRQNDCKTLADMKHTEKDDDFNLQSVSKELVFKDCHVITDDSSYADWLLSQGIDDSVQLPPITERKTLNLKKLYVKTNLNPLCIVPLKVQMVGHKEIVKY